MEEKGEVRELELAIEVLVELEMESISELEESVGDEEEEGERGGE